MAVLFDLDGTLLDTAPDFVVATNKILAQKGWPLVGYADLKPLISWGSKCIIENIFKIQPENPQFTLLVDTLLANYQATNFTDTKPFPGIEELLLNLATAQIPWGIVTNKLTYLTNPLLKRHNFATHAKCIVCGDTTTKPKPAPEPLWYASELINTAPQNCIYIGDAKHDIIAGNSAGMYTISALYGYISDYNAALAWPANNNVTTVKEIFPLVQQWHQQQRLIN